MKSNKFPERAKNSMVSRIIKLISFIFLAYSLVTLPAVIFDDDHYPRTGMLEKQLEKLETDNQRLHWEMNEMKKEISSLRSDPEIIKRVARQEFGYVTDSEVIFILE